MRRMLDQSRRKRPRDPNQLAKLITGIATGQIADGVPAPAIGDKDAAAVSLGRCGGRKGDKARAAELTPEERSAILRQATKSRWK